MKYLFLSGGLGNQMFEYAFFLSCKARGMRIKMNRDLYAINNMHNGYLLHQVFDVSEKDVTASGKLSVFLTRLLRRFHPLGLVYSEKPLVYCEDAFMTKKVFYDGCFIEPRYFESIKEEVRDAFIFKHIDPENTNLGNKMLCENSVSIHIRRGDFLKNPIYGVCDEHYYTQAIEHICAKVDNPVFYVFSDDPDWCKSFMKSKDVNYLIMSLNKGLDSYKDMYLMTRCRNNIIANSTFSWWGAWLNANKDKVVVSPNKWTTTILMDYSDLNWFFINV